MKIKINRKFLALPFAWLMGAGIQAAELPVTPGPFQPTMDSLTNYSCPEWFRDAKFGIWAHWGPQAVPMEGDWYARKMYQQGSPDYKDHLARFGHPSTNGWKDIIPLWKAEKWQPDKLMALYKKAGARYFVSMGTHHDDFFLWNSKLHQWNAVNYGPHRDVVAAWQKAAKKNDLPFGVSEHLGASFTWFQDSHKSDKTGPFAGVPYDGANSNYWGLYHFPAEPGDTKWYSNNPRWQQQWFGEIKELVDNYHPDLLYSDGPVPFGNEVGLSMIADLYNDSLQHNHGKLTAIYNCKQPSEGRWVQDYERGVNGGINPHPWQTDTSIGDWFYNRHWKYQPLSWTVHMLVDIVSKNGNLLLNVVLRPDGSLDPEVDTMLHELAGWTATNGEAIYGTRPWLLYGEGPMQAKGGAFKENYEYTARDIRFTTKGKTLYAIALGWPEDGKVFIKSLAKTDEAGMNEIQSVELLGYKGKLVFEQTAEGLMVTLPAVKLSDLTCSLKITGGNLKPAIPAVTAPLIHPDARGGLFLSATNAQLHGSQIQLETQGGLPDIGFWDNGDEWVSWRAQVAKAGAYNVSATIATFNGDNVFVVEAGGETISGQVPATTGWDQFQTTDLGQIQIKQPGDLVVKFRAKDKASWKALNLNSVKLTPVDPAAAATALSLHWISSTKDEPWKEQPAVVFTPASTTDSNVVTLDPKTVYQSIDGFGGCFHELGWDALQALDDEQRATALKALFDASGCNFNLCRASMGANDFALEWYSFDETPGDYALTNFSIARDRKILIPFIKAAMQYQPKLAIWGVPWSPPSWMKTSDSYKGGNMKTDPQTFAAYALYFSKYVQAYRNEGINLYAIHPQNEPNYNNNVYPQCAWTGSDLNTFLRDYLVPQLKKDQLDVQVWLGTIVKENLGEYVDPVLGDAVTSPLITGVGYQWGGQDALLATHDKYPDKKLMETETECNNGANSWEQGMTTFRKMIQDLNHFAGSYMYWNLVLNEKSTSTWGWKQNSLLKIDTQAKTITYNPEFYSLKHFGHFVQPGATRIAWSAPASPFTDRNLAVFRNPSGELIVILGNESQDVLPITLQHGTDTAKLDLPANSMNSLVLSGW